MTAAYLFAHLLASMDRRSSPMNGSLPICAQFLIGSDIKNNYFPIDIPSPIPKLTSKQKIMNARHYTNQLLEMIENGLLDRDNVIMTCVKYMSESDVEDMMRCNEFLMEDEEEEEEEEIEEEEELEAEAWD